MRDKLFEGYNCNNGSINIYLQFMMTDIEHNLMKDDFKIYT